MIEMTCDLCGAPFLARARNQRFCSAYCCNVVSEHERKEKRRGSRQDDPDLPAIQTPEITSKKQALEVARAAFYAVDGPLRTKFGTANIAARDRDPEWRRVHAIWFNALTDLQEEESPMHEKAAVIGRPRIVIHPSEIKLCTSCGAPIVWCLTPKGKRMPVDAAPVPDGKMLVTRTLRGTHEVETSLPDGESPRWNAHFATCPHAQGWKR